ncbi:MAG: hypothetical protein LBD85_04355, partial [Oscillospiraceae bacterium]|jgi:hypothetical protein|nr:hypothetical protein [Oscillospiraceae bacterium]
LSAKLRELGATTESAASHQSEIKAVISALNEELPGLALNYDDVIERTAKYTGGLDAAARAIRRQREEEAQLAAYQSKLDLEISLKKEKEAREADVAAAKKQVEASKKVYDAALSEVEGKKNYSQRIQSGLAKERSAYESASRELAIYEAQLAEVNGSISANAAAMEEMNAAWVAMESETESAEGMASAIDAVSGKISELAARYQEAYDAAKASVDGQYEIWDKAATIAPVKASQIGAALESQFAYWEKYNSNLESLYSRTSGIDGLNEFLASFADGSAESVNVIAGLSTADDATLRKAIDTWNKVRAQEEKVENSLANMATDFKNATAEIQSELETRVAEMDLSEAAMENGKATIEGFIEGASEMLPEVQEAYGKLGAAAMLALGENQRIRILTGSPQSGYYGEIPGYAGGTTDAPEAFIAGEAGPELILGARGASVFPHTETRRIIEAAASDYSYAGARITLSPVYNISGFDSSEVSGALSEQNEALREIIRDALLEIENNKRRLAYK